MSYTINKRFSVGLMGLLLAVLCGYAGQAADKSAWMKAAKAAAKPTMRAIGPGNGGAMFGIGFKPDNPKVIIFGGDMGATYRSVDGGLSWEIIGGEPANQPHATYVVAFHPKKTNIVWALGSGVYKSEDAGKTWVNTHPPKGTYGAIGLDPDNPDIAYIAEGMVPRIPLKWVHGSVYKTVDGGKTWRELPKPELKSSAKKINAYNYTNLIVDPTSPVIKGEGHSRVYIFGRGGIFRSDDAGKSWKELSKSFAEGQIADMVLVRKGQKTILFATAIPGVGLKKGGVYRSDDKGETWTPCNNGLGMIIRRLKRYNRGLAKNPNTYAFTLMIAHSPAKPNRLYVGSWQGGARSDDLGKTWKTIIPPESTYLKNPVKGTKYRYIPLLRHTRKYKKSLWGGADSFHRLVAAPSNGDIAAFSDNQGLYCTFDGGKTWDDMTFDYGKQFAPNVFKRGPKNRYTHTTRSRGVQNIVCRGIVVDPFNPKIYYAAYMDIGLEISRDGGEYWEHPFNGLYARGHAWSVAVDPKRKGRVLVTIGGKFKRQSAGIFESNDFGKSWKRIGLDGDAKDVAIFDVKIDYSSPANKRTIYLATRTKGVYKSTDDGKSWKSCSANWSKAEKATKKIEITPDGKSVYVGTDAGLMVSHDRGRTWSLMKQKLFSGIKDFSVSKSNPNYIYVSANYYGKGYWSGSAFFMTSDGGKHWKKISPPYMKFTGGIMVNPYNPKYVYACIDRGAPKEGVIIRSKDGGKTWENIGGKTPFTRGVKFSIDSHNAQHLFVFTRFGLLEMYDPQAPTK